MDTQDLRDRQNRNKSVMRAIYGIGMGLLIFVVGVAALIAKYKNWLTDLQFFQDEFVYYIAGIFILYGGFRIYRGFAELK
jgi:FtsH-binding integral membrane protein